MSRSKGTEVDPGFLYAGQGQLEVWLVGPAQDGKLKIMDLSAFRSA